MQYNNAYDYNVYSNEEVMNMMNIVNIMMIVELFVDDISVYIAC